jgi:hypothetical protein
MNPRAIVRLERLGKKNSMAWVRERTILVLTVWPLLFGKVSVNFGGFEKDSVISSGLQPTAFRLVAVPQQPSLPRTPYTTPLLFDFRQSILCGSLPREPPTGYPKPVSRKQLDKQDFHGNQQMQHVLLWAVFSLGSAWIRAFPWQPAENSTTSSPSDIDKDGREWPVKPVTKTTITSMTEVRNCDVMIFVIFNPGDRSHIFLRMSV